MLPPTTKMLFDAESEMGVPETMMVGLPALRLVLAMMIGELRESMVGVSALVMSGRAESVAEV